MKHAGWKQIIEPVADCRPHIDSEHCLCNPRVDDGVLIHNAFDGRHLRERYDEQHGSDGLYPSSTDCTQLGNLFLLIENQAMTFCSGLTQDGEWFSFEICKAVGKYDDPHEIGPKYRVTFKIEEV